MKENSIQAGPDSKTPFWYLYLASVVMLAFTGFGQMPLYKRYYICGHPRNGMVCGFLHHPSGSLHFFRHSLRHRVLCRVQSRADRGKKALPLPPPDMSGRSSIAGLMVSGLLLVTYNFAGVSLPMWAAATLLFTHMGFAMALIVAGLIVIIRKKPWVVPR